MSRTGDHDMAGMLDKFRQAQKNSPAGYGLTFTVIRSDGKYHAQFAGGPTSCFENNKDLMMWIAQEINDRLE